MLGCSPTTPRCLLSFPLPRVPFPLRCAPSTFLSAPFPSLLPSPPFPFRALSRTMRSLTAELATSLPQTTARFQPPGLEHLPSPLHHHLSFYPRSILGADLPQVGLTEGLLPRAQHLTPGLSSLPDALPVPQYFAGRAPSFPLCPGCFTRINTESWSKQEGEKHFPLVFQIFPDFFPLQLTSMFSIYHIQTTGISLLSPLKNTKKF